jgi:hypothetical protein
VAFGGLNETAVEKGKCNMEEELLQISAMICLNHRAQCGIQSPLKVESCTNESCQLTCPITQMVQQQNDWLRGEFKLRKQEEREIMNLETKLKNIREKNEL